MAEPDKLVPVSEYIFSCDNVRKWYKTGNPAEPRPGYNDAEIIAAEIELLLRLLPDEGATKREIAYLIIGMDPKEPHTAKEIDEWACEVPRHRIYSLSRLSTTMFIGVFYGLQITMHEEIPPIV